MDNRIVVVLVPPADIRGLWPTICDWIENIAERSNGLWSGPTLLHSIEAGVRLLFLIWDREAKAAQAICIADISNSDLGVRSLNLIAAAGHDRFDWQDLLIDTAKKFAAEMGCKRITAIARPGWSKSLRHRMKMTHVFLEEAI